MIAVIIIAYIAGFFITPFLDGCFADEYRDLKSVVFVAAIWPIVWFLFVVLGIAKLLYRVGCDIHHMRKHPED